MNLLRSLFKFEKVFHVHFPPIESDEKTHMRIVLEKTHILFYDMLSHRMLSDVSTLGGGEEDSIIIWPVNSKETCCFVLKD